MLPVKCERRIYVYQASPIDQGLCLYTYIQISELGRVSRLLGYNLFYTVYVQKRAYLYIKLLDSEISVILILMIVR